MVAWWWLIVVFAEGILSVASPVLFIVINFSVFAPFVAIFAFKWTMGRMLTMLNR